MKNPMFWPITVVAVALTIAGFVFFATATDRSVLAEPARTPSLIAGITCLVLAIGLLVLGAFLFRKRE